MEDVYFYLKSFTDPLAFVLVLMAAVLWILKDLRKHHYKKFGWWILLSNLLCLYLLSISPVVSCLAYVLEKDCLLQEHDKVKEIDVVVVLGGSVLRRGMQKEFDPSNETASRLLSGLRLLKRTNAKFIVLSGRSNRTRSDAEVMARISNELGVDESKIIVESKSLNTYEHAVELDQLLMNKEITIGIATSALHMKRSIKVFSKYFNNIVPLPSRFLYSPKKLTAKSFVPNSYRLYLSSTLIHEFIGLLWYNIRR